MITDKQARELADRYGTSLYVFDLAKLRERVQAIRQVLGGDIGLCYAMKANPFLVGYLAEVVDGIEVCSPGELDICRKLNVPEEKIILSGVHKSELDFQQLFQKQFHGLVTIESKLQFKYLLDNLQPGQEVDVIFRLTSGTQFGMERDEFICLVDECKKHSHVHFCGLHYFSGTQKRDLKVMRQDIASLSDFISDLKEQAGVEALRLEYGPGLFVDYFGNGDMDDDIGLLEEVAKALKAAGGQIAVELGRYIAASCGYYITKVVDMKSNLGNNFCIVDGGIHHIHYFGQMLGIKVPKFRHIKSDRNEKESGEDLWSVCGSLCTIHDYLLRNARLDSVDIGDLFLFQSVGAYSMTESISLFLSRDLPLVLLIDDDGKEVIAREHLSTSRLNCAGGIADGLD